MSMENDMIALVLYLAWGTVCSFIAGQSLANSWDGSLKAKEAAYCIAMVLLWPAMIPGTIIGAWLGER